MRHSVLSTLSFKSRLRSDRRQKLRVIWLSLREYKTRRHRKGLVGSAIAIPMVCGSSVTGTHDCKRCMKLRKEAPTTSAGQPDASGIPGTICMTKADSNWPYFSTPVKFFSFLG
ncbi:hypothetical protein LY78DRAFT_657976, partial [Colletotrichum sublineola]